MRPFLAAAVGAAALLGLKSGLWADAAAWGPGPDAAQLLQAAQAAESKGDHYLAIHYFRHCLDRDASNAGARSGLQAALQRAGWRQRADGSLARSESREPGEAGIAAPPRTAEALEKGLAAWVFGDAASWCGQVNAYNLSAPLGQRLKHLFVPCGRLAFQRGEAGLRWNEAGALAMASGLEGDARVYALVQGSVEGADSLAPAQWEKLAKDLAARADAQERIAGLVLQLEPHSAQVDALCARVRAHSSKPVGVACGLWDPETFRDADFVALTAWDLAGDPQAYGRAVRDLVGAFLRDALQQQEPVFLGVPAAATRQEYESSADSAGGARRSTGHAQSEYTDAVRQAVGLADPVPTLLGLALWALRPGGGLHESGDAHWYFPSDIGAAQWDAFKLPLGKP